MSATTSGVVEAQSRFASTTNAVTLSSATSYIELKVLFTDTLNLIKSNGGTNALNSTINVGLFDSGGISPAAGLQSSGLTATIPNATFGTGFAQNWEGYAARIGATNGSSSINQILTRPIQNANSASANQDLLFMGVGGGTYGQSGVGVAGVSVAQAASTLVADTLTNGTQYQLTYRITKTDDTTYSISYKLSDSTGTTDLQVLGGTTTVSSFITGLSFDGVAIGYRSAQSNSAPGNGTNIATGITLNSLSVDYFSAAAVPEPSSCALLAGLGVIGLAATRRRRER